ncbi:Dehydrogenase/reductase SDR family member 11 [Araneus ventricosus]|uniref:Dehydrogenase/reductase SDR family member 11 n=1 Tax=Araneus ventricosus TaxID=182803 RepID=A0A4Y1ZTF6_ARAVE|nr:Dehydrogenase/reductase SDR family member 11 [Araneus ventricosus]
MERWEGRVALVTGASMGIGAELCRALLQHGLMVVGCARSVDKIKAIAQEDAVKNSPGRLVAINRTAIFEEILSPAQKIKGRYDC